MLDRRPWCIQDGYRRDHQQSIPRALFMHVLTLALDDEGYDVYG